jgi:hypothetical protein
VSPTADGRRSGHEARPTQKTAQHRERPIDKFIGRGVERRRREVQVRLQGCTVALVQHTLALRPRDGLEVDLADRVLLQLIQLDEQVASPRAGCPGEPTSFVPAQTKMAAFGTTSPMCSRISGLSAIVQVAGGSRGRAQNYSRDGKAI